MRDGDLVRTDGYYADGATIRQIGRGSHPRRGKAATERLTVSLTPDERKVAESAARAAGKKLATWAAGVLVAAVRTSE
jgi:hypothetical protein